MLDSPCTTVSAVEVVDGQTLVTHARIPYPHRRGEEEGTPPNALNHE